MPLGLRLLFYACLGVTAEVVFTAFAARFGIVLTADLDEPAARREWRLKGHSFVWMVPIYAVGLLAFEILHDVLRAEPWPLRGVLYVVVLYVIEAAASLVLVRATGGHVWRWVGRGAIGGHVHLAMAPLWFLAFLALEPLHDFLAR
jgi:hypothetical protein